MVATIRKKSCTTTSEVERSLSSPEPRAARGVGLGDLTLIPKRFECGEGGEQPLKTSRFRCEEISTSSDFGFDMQDMQVDIPSLWMAFPNTPGGKPLQ